MRPDQACGSWSAVVGVAPELIGRRLACLQGGMRRDEVRDRTGSTKMVGGGANGHGRWGAAEEWSGGGPAANGGGRKGQDEALVVERSVARDSLSEWQLSKESVASRGTCDVWRRWFWGSSPRPRRARGRLPWASWAESWGR